jgi:hypothetical protein
VPRPPSGRRLDLVVTKLEAERALKHVPGLVVSVVDVERRDPVRPDFGRPFDDYEVVVGRSQRSSGESLDEHRKKTRSS